MQLRVNQQKCSLCRKCQEVCPFAAISIGSKVEINAACKLCKLCLKHCPEQAMYLDEAVKESVDKDAYSGILVVAEAVEKSIHPITYELIGKARELADKLGQSVTVVMLGFGISQVAGELLDYGVDRVYVYDHMALAHFRIEPFLNLIASMVERIQPSTVLIGATPLGRSLAPRVAVRFRTGLTADCTVLAVKENSDLVQIRPAFGGNIMAQILTPNNRPQLATVRYKVMESAKPKKIPGAKLTILSIPENLLQSRSVVVASRAKPEGKSITETDVVIAVGRGIKERKDLQIAEELAQLLGGMVGVSRPLVECGWADHTRQIGLSGRSIRPKLLITLGVSGAIQFSAGASGAEIIFAINQDAKAPIFDLAHYGLVGDLYEIVPKLIDQIREGRGLANVL